MKKIYFYFYFFLLLVCGWLILNYQPQGEHTYLISYPLPKEFSDSNQASISTPLKDPQQNSPIAIVNGMAISRSEVDQEMDSLFHKFKDMAFPEKTEEFNSKLWKQALENVINRKLLFQEAERQNIRPEEALIEERIAEIARKFHTRKRFEKQLANLQISEEKLRQEIEHDLKIKILLDRHIPPVEDVSQEEIEEFYHANSESFHIPERVRASHILISVSDEDDPKTHAQKRQRLFEIREDIKNGEKFQKLARKYSDCESKSKGGDLGYFAKGKMVKSFEDVAFQLEVNELSDIIKTEYGYHLIKLTDRQESRIVPLEEAKDKIISFLQREKRDLAIRDYLLNLRSISRIEYFKDISP